MAPKDRSHSLTGKTTPAPAHVDERLASPGPGHTVLLGALGRAQGLKGEVRLISYADDPLSIATLGPFDDEGRRIVITGIREQGDKFIATIEGVTDRTQAEALNGAKLFVPRQRLQEPDDEDTFLHTDLIGCRVAGPVGNPIGAVVALPNYGGGELLEILPVEGGETLLLPFTKAFVPLVNIKERTITIDPPGGWREESSENDLSQSS